MSSYNIIFEEVTLDTMEDKADKIAATQQSAPDPRRKESDKYVTAFPDLVRLLRGSTRSNYCFQTSVSDPKICLLYSQYSAHYTNGTAQASGSANDKSANADGGRQATE